MRLYLHAVYLINLASEDSTIHESSVRSVTWAMTTAARLGAEALVIHVGSHRGHGFEDVRGRIRSALDAILANSPAGPFLLLENSAGAGGNIGGDLRELGTILDDVGRPPQLGVCVDTAHAFAAGYDLCVPQGVQRLIGNVRLFRRVPKAAPPACERFETELGSGRDRHENIGVGFIGLDEAFAILLARPEIGRLPLVLETPNLDRRAGELAALREAYASTRARQPSSGGDDYASPALSRARGMSSMIRFAYYRGLRRHIPASVLGTQKRSPYKADRVSQYPRFRRSAS